MKFKKYTYLYPERLPVDWDSGPDLSDLDFRKSGFNPNDEEIATGVLTDNWNGHALGSTVISGLTIEGHPFAVEVNGRIQTAGSEAS